MKLQAVLFDLDGTLLPMDQDAFTKGYFGLLAQKLEPLGYEKKELVKAIWDGTSKMVQNDGSRSNEDAFWNRFAELYGNDILAEKEIFNDFYRNEFLNAKAFCGFNPEVPALLKKIKEMGLRVVLATNPIFPSIATEARIRWAGLEPSDFEFITTYENIGYCKPNPEYYRELTRRMKLQPEECIMVGNDVEEDMIAAETGMQVFLIPDCIVNHKDIDYSNFPQGNFQSFSRMLDELSQF